MPAPLSLGPSRWRGRAGRVETWYATFTDPRTGDGFWVHAELVASRAGVARAQGWAAVFPADGPPEVRRFGPVDVGAASTSDAWFDAAGVVVGADVLRGTAGELSWDLRWFDPGARPLFTFPRWAWERELLPGAQVVPAPTASFSGTFRFADRVFRLDDARGAVSRILGHGAAERWAWLHADLGDGDVLELVAAQARRRTFRPLGVLPFVQLRLGDEVWPKDPFVAALKGQSDLRLPTFTVELTDGDRRLAIEVDLPPERCVAVELQDPDGATATCTNSERASARIVLEHRTPERWLEERRWSLDLTAHAELGLRP